MLSRKPVGSEIYSLRHTRTSRPRAGAPDLAASRLEEHWLWDRLSLQMPRVSGTPLGPRQAVRTDTRCLIDSLDRGEQRLAPGLNILCVAAACACQFPNLSDMLTSVSMGVGSGVEVALSPAQQPSLHFFSPVRILGSSRSPCPSSPALLPSLEGAENLPKDAVA